MPVDPFAALNALLRAEAARTADSPADRAAAEPAPDAVRRGAAAPEEPGPAPEGSAL